MVDRRRRPLRLGFVSGRFVSVESDGLYSDVPLGRLIDELGARVDTMTIALSVEPRRRELDDHRLHLGASSLVPLPWMPSVRAGFHQVLPSVHALREVRRRSDVVIIQLPFTAPLALPFDAGPTVFHVCADQRAIVRSAQTRKGLERAAAIAVADGTDVLHRALIGGPRRIVTHGRALLTRYGGPSIGRAVVSSSLADHEVESVARARGRTPFRVLFVGYLRPEKGIDVLLEAMRAVAARIPDVELEIVGPGDSADAATSDRIRAARAVLGDRLILSPGRNFGPELFRAYADADVLALPSRSEGTPRVLVEARAFRCPVVASDVGGIPSSIENEVDGLLVPPDDPVGLAAALVRVAEDASLRERLVDAGLRRARASTVEAFADAILDEAERAIESA